MRNSILILLALLSFSCQEKENKFPLYIQKGNAECGTTCLKMVLEYYGKSISIDSLNRLAKLDRINGTNFLYLSEAADSLGFKSLGVMLNFNSLTESPLPAIIHWNENHFIVVNKIVNDTVYVTDPAIGLLKYHKKEFCESWYQLHGTDKNLGKALLIVDKESTTKMPDFK